MNDRRHFFRVAFQSPTALECPDGTVEARLLDISLRGALVELPDGAPVPRAGDPCVLTLSLDDEDHIRMEAVVAYADGQRAGLSCRAIDLESVTHLRRLVELNLGDETLLERELSALIKD